MGHKGKCLGSVVLLICLSSTFAQRILLDPFPMMRKPHRDHIVKTYLTDGPGPDLRGRRFGSGTSLGYGFGPAACGTCGEGLDAGGGSGGGGYFPPLKLGHDGRKSDKGGTMNMMSQAVVASPLP